MKQSEGVIFSQNDRVVQYDLLRGLLTIYWLLPFLGLAFDHNLTSQWYANVKYQLSKSPRQVDRIWGAAIRIWKHFIPLQPWSDLWRRDEVMWRLLTHKSFYNGCLLQEAALKCLLPWHSLDDTIHALETNCQSYVFSRMGSRAWPDLQPRELSLKR